MEEGDNSSRCFKEVYEAGLGADMNKGCPPSTSSVPTLSSISSCCGFSESYGSRRSFSTSAMRFLYPTICSRHAWRDTPNLRVGENHIPTQPWNSTTTYTHNLHTRPVSHPWTDSPTLQLWQENFQEINITLNKALWKAQSRLVPSLDDNVWDFFITVNSDFLHWNPIITIHSSIECL